MSGHSMTTSATSATSATYRLFDEPDKEIGARYHPTTKRERELLTDALLPTFKLWARWLLGLAPAPDDSSTIYAQMAGLRHFLLTGLQRERWLDREHTLRHDIGPEMISYCWYRLLTESERRALGHFARTGEQQIAQRGFFTA